MAHQFVPLLLAVNHLPHNHLTNQFMYVVTAVMNAGFGWVAGLMIAAALSGARERRETSAEVSSSAAAEPATIEITAAINQHVRVFI